jgi:ATP-dependent RNA helicase DDX35
MSATAGKHLFWKPGAQRPAALPELEKEPVRGETTSAVYNPHANLSFAQQRRRLPIFDERRALLYMVETYATVVVAGHTGCGKTTQIPQYLDEAGWTAGGRLVACTQPRRVAATSVAERVAEEMGVPLGTAVGYAVRFDDCCDSSTRIKYMTDGRLIREMMRDPLLTEYSCVMVDEAHERSRTTDILLGLLKKVRRKRPDLRLIIASATLDAESFLTFFEEGIDVHGQPTEKSAAAISLRGSTAHPITWHFLEQVRARAATPKDDAIMLPSTLAPRVREPPALTLRAACPHAGVPIPIVARFCCACAAGTQLL